MTGPELTGRDLIGYGRDRPRRLWPGGAKVAVNVVVNIEEGAERTFDPDGVTEGLIEVPRNAGSGQRDFAVESMYEYGSRVGAVRLLSLLRRRGVRATAFAAAQALERNPPVVSELVEGGHEVCAHGYRWAESWTMTEDEESAAIARAYDGIASLTGTAPVGWYSRWMRSARTRRLLLAHGGFRYDADAYNDDLPYYDGDQLVVPYSLTYNDAHYSYGTFAAPGDFVEYCLRAVDFLTHEPDEAPALVSIGLHPRISGQAARADAVREIVDALLPRADVWLTTRAEIADHWRGATA
ncbi:polysaccharide deacetylase family protein [Actinoplanes sp. NPDC051411]|uniref:polysaccharide deacetylase family protein n=1 Tax=Actinoplanes sp. NPDC051411 TaxID=3155522 RepID=UPI0034372AEC